MIETGDKSPYPETIFISYWLIQIKKKNFLIDKYLCYVHLFVIIMLSINMLRTYMMPCMHSYMPRYK